VLPGLELLKRGDRDPNSKLKKICVSSSVGDPDLLVRGTDPDPDPYLFSFLIKVFAD
jgi:hypothetical protein